MLMQCILAMRSDLSESSSFTCARDIEEGRSTFEEVANGRPIDADRLVALQEAWKAAEVAYKTALEEECKRSGQKRMSVGHAVERARKRAHAERSRTEREKEYAEWYRLLDEAAQAKKSAPEAVFMTTLEYLDQPPIGWFPLDVMKSGPRKRDWVALMVDVHPDELKHCLCKTAFLYVHPNEYRPDGSRTAREAWVRVPGKHRDKDAAWDALQDMMTTRH
jgi:hypothetical protein